LLQGFCGAYIDYESTSTAAAAAADTTTTTSAKHATTKQLCLFPMITDEQLSSTEHAAETDSPSKTTPPAAAISAPSTPEQVIHEQQEQALSPTSATLQAATNTTDLVVVNPSAFGKFIPSEVTMQTARLISQVGNIDSEDWARHYQFQQVMWPNRQVRQMQLLAQSLANDLTSTTNTNDDIHRIVIGTGSSDNRVHAMFGRPTRSPTTVTATATTASEEEKILYQYGLIGTTFQAILKRLPKHAVCVVSLYELLQEKEIRDLLATDTPINNKPKSTSSPRLRYPSDQKGVTVEGLTEFPINSLQGLWDCLQPILVRHDTSNNRGKGKNFKNLSSFQHYRHTYQGGHVVVSLKILPSALIQEKLHLQSATLTICNLADTSATFSGHGLAKTPTEHRHTNHNRTPQKEQLSPTTTTLTSRQSTCLRQSASSLGSVLCGALLRESGQDTIIPYRDSTLTKVLQRPIGHSDSRIVVVASLSPLSRAYHNTLATLRFVGRLLDHSVSLPTSPFKRKTINVSSPVPSPSKRKTLASASPQLLMEQFTSKESILKSVVTDPRQRLGRFYRGLRSQRHSDEQSLEQSISGDSCEIAWEYPSVSSDNEDGDGDFHDVTNETGAKREMDAGRLEKASLEAQTQEQDESSHSNTIIYGDIGDLMNSSMKSESKQQERKDAIPSNLLTEYEVPDSLEEFQSHSSHSHSELLLEESPRQSLNLECPQQGQDGVSKSKSSANYNISDELPGLFDSQSHNEKVLQESAKSSLEPASPSHQHNTILQRKSLGKLEVPAELPEQFDSHSHAEIFLQGSARPSLEPESSQQQHNDVLQRKTFGNYKFPGEMPGQFDSQSHNEIFLQEGVRSSLQPESPQHQDHDVLSADQDHDVLSAESLATYKFLNALPRQFDSQSQSKPLVKESAGPSLEPESPQHQYDDALPAKSFVEYEAPGLPGQLYSHIQSESLGQENGREFLPQESPQQHNDALLEKSVAEYEALELSGQSDFHSQSDLLVQENARPPLPQEPPQQQQENSLLTKSFTECEVPELSGQFESHSQSESLVQESARPPLPQEPPQQHQDDSCMATPFVEYEVPELSGQFDFQSQAEPLPPVGAKPSLLPEIPQHKQSDAFAKFEVAALPRQSESCILDERSLQEKSMLRKASTFKSTPSTTIGKRPDVSPDFYPKESPWEISTEDEGRPNGRDANSQQKEVVSAAVMTRLFPDTPQMQDHVGEAKKESSEQLSSQSGLVQHQSDTDLQFPQQQSLFVLLEQRDAALDSARKSQNECLKMSRMLMELEKEKHTQCSNLEELVEKTKADQAAIEKIAEEAILAQDKLEHAIADLESELHATKKKSQTLDYELHQMLQSNREVSEELYNTKNELNSTSSKVRDEKEIIAELRYRLKVTEKEQAQLRLEILEAQQEKYLLKLQSEKEQEILRLEMSEQARHFLMLQSKQAERVETLAWSNGNFQRRLEPEEWPRCVEEHQSSRDDVIQLKRREPHLLAHDEFKEGSLQRGENIPLKRNEQDHTHHDFKKDPMQAMDIRTEFDVFPKPGKSTSPHLYLTQASLDLRAEQIAACLACKTHAPLAW